VKFHYIFSNQISDFRAMFLCTMSKNFLLAGAERDDR